MTMSPLLHCNLKIFCLYQSFLLEIKLVKTSNKVPPKFINSQTFLNPSISFHILDGWLNSPLTQATFKYPSFSDLNTPFFRSIIKHNSVPMPIFGKYEMGKMLGCGAFAKVYHARNVLSGENVAIKVINKNKLAGTTLTSNIKTEISIMSKLNHPNIVKLYEVLGSRTKIYLVMEFVKGGQLATKVSKGRFTEEMSRKYFRQLISAVRYCHSRGVYHRDLKLENLLVDENGDLKVTDFGLSAVTDQIRQDGFLYTVCGTPTYVAPEILLQKGYDGAKADVWSAGVVLFVLAAGYLPFNDPNLMAQYKKILKGEFECPKRMSPVLQRFISRLLDTNPATRITVDEILQDPCFKNGEKIEKFNNDDNSESEIEENELKGTTLNAFDLISFSSGLDLTGLFDDSYDSVDDDERFVSTELPEKVMQRFSEIAEVENLTVKRKKEWRVEMESQNRDVVIRVEINRLTEELVVVEVKRRGGNARCYRNIWQTKLKNELCGQLC